MAVYQDGNFPSGSPVITINSVGYIAEDFQVQDSASTQNQADQNGEHSGALSFKGPLRGTASLQLASSSTSWPQPAARNSTWGVFVATVYNASVTCFIDSVSIRRPNQNKWMADINWQGRVN